MNRAAQEGNGVLAEKGWRRWLLFGVASVTFFHITGATFTSLGVVLPHMIEALSWSMTEAGAGFTLLALLTGLASTVPAWTLRRLGAKATYGLGGAIMVAGFILLALADGLQAYFLGAALLGLGFPLCATVPGVHLLNNWLPDRRSFAIGAYMTIGGLGGVAGPLVATGIINAATGAWRVHWWVMAAVSLALALAALATVKTAPGRPAAGGPEEEETPGERHSNKVYQSGENWSLREALRTPAYYVIVAAMTMTLFCGVTMNAWTVAHLGGLGVPAAIAAGALSAQAAVNALSRLAGGALATRIDPKWLLASGLLAEAIGMLALAVADDPFSIALFAIAEGYGFGMCLFATTVLLINYFGPKNNPELLGALNLITTVAMLGPVAGGLVGDRLGGVAILFQGYALLLLIIFMLALLMKPPRK